MPASLLLSLFPFHVKTAAAAAAAWHFYSTTTMPCLSMPSIKLLSHYKMRCHLSLLSAFLCVIPLCPTYICSSPYMYLLGRCLCACLPPPTSCLYSVPVFWRVRSYYGYALLLKLWKEKGRLSQRHDSVQQTEIYHKLITSGLSWDDLVPFNIPILPLP